MDLSQLLFKVKIHPVGQYSTFGSAARMMDFTHKRVLQILSSILKLEDEDVEFHEEVLSDED